MITRKIIISRYLVLLMGPILLLVPMQAVGMCAKQVPYKIKIKVTHCTKEYVKGLGLTSEGIETKWEQELRWSVHVKKDCTKFKIGQIVEVNIEAACCDTPDTDCYFGTIVTGASDSPE